MAAIISRNFSLHSTSIPRLTPGMEAFVQPGFTYVDSGLSCDTFNILHISDSALVTAAALTEAVVHYRKKKFAFCIWIDEENLNDQIIALFSSLNIRQQHAQPGMILTLDHYQEIHHPLHKSMRFIHSMEELEQYALVTAANWTPPDQHVLSYYRASVAQVLSGQHNIRLAAYYENDQMVSVAELFPSDTATAGIYGLATLQQQRGKGIGSAMMSFVLNTAKRSGYTNAVLQASEEGSGIYRKLGFSVQGKFYEFA